MSAHIRRIIQNTRERALSTDWNDSTNLMHRALLEAAVMLSSGGESRRYGVLSGLEVGVSGVAHDVTVSAGIALAPRSSPGADDSEAQWVELTSGQTVDLSTYVDGANPRWVAIEIAANEEVELSSLRDLFNPALGTFTGQTVEKRRRSAPSLSVNAGTPDATPQLPAGTSGTIPLAYVYIPASAASLVVGDEVRCRPIVAGTGASFVARGGGVGTETTAAGNAVFQEASGRFEGSQAEWRIAGATTFAVDASTMLGGALPASDSWIYFYAAPVPYPAGHDTTLAPREFVPGASAETRLGLAPQGTRGCIIVADVVAPNDVASRQGAPASVTGPIAVTAVAFAGATPAPADLVYLGAAYLDVSAVELGPQSTRGDATYLIVGSGFALASNWPPNEQVTSGSLTTYDASSYGTSGLPDTADRLLHFEAYVEGSGSAVTRLTVADELHGDTSYRFEVTASVFDSESGMLLVDDSRQWRMSRDNVSGSDDPRMRIIGFQDSILGSR